MPPSLEDLERRIQALERAERDRESLERRAKDDRRHEFDTMLAGARQILERSLEGMMPIQHEQLQLLKDAQDERLMRRAREKISAEEKIADEIAQAKKDASRRHLTSVLVIVVPIVSALAAMVGQVIASLYH